MWKSAVSKRPRACARHGGLPPRVERSRRRAMARESVSPAEIAPPPAAEREARDADPAAERREGLEPSASPASPDGSEVPSPREAGERAETRADHERERVDEQDDRAEADWDDVLERLARVDRDLDAFVARPDDDDDGLKVSTPFLSKKTPRAVGGADLTAADLTAAVTDAVTDAVPMETRGEASRVVLDDATLANETDPEREPEPMRMQTAASRGLIERLAARMMSSLERHRMSSLERDASVCAEVETRAERAEAVAAVEAFYDALLERREKESPRGDSATRDVCETFAKNASFSRGDGVEELRRLLETL